MQSVGDSCVFILIHGQ